MTPQYPAAPETDACNWPKCRTQRDLPGCFAWCKCRCHRKSTASSGSTVGSEAALLAKVQRLQDELAVTAEVRDVAQASTRLMQTRAESAEAAHEAEKAAHERLRDEFDELADDFASNVDWSAGRGNYGDNQAWESAARQVRALLAGGGAR